MARAISAVTAANADRVVQIASGPGAGLWIKPGRTNLGYAVGSTEREVQELLRAHVRPGSTFYDIGANIGFFTVSGARMVGPEGKVLSFEPLPATAARLRENVELNRFSHVEVIEAAVADFDGTAPLDVGRSELSARLADDAVGERSVVDVRVVTIDEGVARLDWPRPDVLKIDAEGHEAHVLRGMAATIRAARPLLVIELHWTQDEVVPLLREMGYELTEVDVPGAVDTPCLGHVLATPRRKAELTSCGFS